MYRIILIQAILMFAFIFVVPTGEAKVLPRFNKISNVSTQKYSNAASTSVRLRSDRHALNVSFNNLQSVSSIYYALSYQTNGKEEGAGGTIDTAGNPSLSRELLFGTCSSGVCRYHTNITNAKFEVTITASSGKKTLKRYRIKV